jgi:hypothetical protein
LFAIVHVNMLKHDGLLAFAAVLIERFHLPGEDAGELGVILNVEVARPKNQSHDPSACGTALSLLLCGCRLGMRCAPSFPGPAWGSPSSRARNAG